MKKIILSICILLIIPVNANAVENGTDAANDTNAVVINGRWSGFLYSPQIVFTVAHTKFAYEQYQSILEK